MRPTLVPKYRSLIFLTSMMMLFYRCSTSEGEFIECVGNIKVEEFLYIGHNGTSDIGFWTNNYETEIPVTGWVDLRFNDDFTFTLQMAMDCDSATSTPPFCELLDYEEGKRTLQITGIWEFQQQITTESWFGPSGKVTRNSLTGSYTLTIVEAPFEIEYPIFQHAYNVLCNSWRQRKIEDLYVEIWITEEDVLQLRFNN